MEDIYVKARAKINLNLEVLNKRKDGYHNIKSVFQKVNLYDEMHIQKTHDNKIELSTNIDELNNNDNIIYKAYKMLENEYKEIDGVEVLLNKRIPMQAGMGGGSTDCASFIISMNRLFDLRMSKDKIESIGKKLGADVVPCLYNRAILAEGIGDIITPIDTTAKYYILIIKPDISCSTKEMYKKIDNLNHQSEDKTEDIIKALKCNNIELMRNNLHNSFEDVVNENIIKEIKSKMFANGAIESLMTGSGSCVFGIFAKREIALKAYHTLEHKYEIYLCTSYNSRRRQIF